MNAINHRGFTIVELLIVIVVIAILAALAIVAYNGTQNRAKAVAIADDLKKAEKGLRLLATERGWTTWPVDNSSSELTGSSNPQISDVISATNLKNYYQEVSPAVASFSSFTYDYDLNTTYPGCSASNTGGVNLYLKSPSQELAQVVDDQIDDGNLSCGRLTWSTGDGGSLRYNISADSTL